jgi:pimeloyl-ACP methyl ester carboxylesterase
VPTDAARPPRARAVGPVFSHVAARAAIRDAGLRLIAPDRPGFGHSQPETGRRSYAGWARDIENLADALELGRFAIVAYSCGGPYALAAARVLQDRVVRVAIVSGVAPSEMPKFRRGTAPTDQLMTRLAPRVPWLARSLVGHSLSLARSKPDRFRNQARKDFPADPDQAIIDEGFGADLVELFLEAGRNGPEGMVEDFAAWARPSGVELEQIEVPTHSRCRAFVEQESDP